MDYANLQAFIAVARNHSFSLAAERMFLTQPAISKRVQSLEFQLGLKLFDRIGRKILLTEAGRILLPRAIQIVNEIADSQRELQQLSDRIEGPFSLATSHHIGLHRLPPILKEYIELYPSVDLDLHFLDSEQILHHVEQGEVDMGVTTLPITASPQLTIEQIWEDRLIPVVGRTHLLAEYSSIDLQLLSAYNALLPMQATTTRRVINEWLEKNGISAKKIIEVNYLETIKMMVGVGMGWSLLPESMLTEELLALSLPSQPVRRSLGMIHHRKFTLSNAARAMVELLVTHRDQ